jgi:tetratricopeptide (TPR) repeat protein
MKRTMADGVISGVSLTTEWLRGMTDEQLDRHLAAWRTTRELSPAALTASPNGPFTEIAQVMSGLPLAAEAARLLSAREPTDTLGVSGGGPAGALYLSQHVADGTIVPEEGLRLLTELQIEDDDLLGICVFALHDERHQMTGSSLTMLNLAGLASNAVDLGAKLLLLGARIVSAQGSEESALKFIEAAEDRMNEGAHDEMLARLLVESASILGGLQYLDDALVRARMAIDLSQRVEAGSVLAYAELNAAATLIGLGRLLEAEDILSSLIPRLELSGDRQAIRVAHQNLERISAHRLQETAENLEEELIELLTAARKYQQRSQEEEWRRTLLEAYRRSAAAPPSPMTVRAAQAYAAALISDGEMSSAKEIVENAIRRASANDRVAHEAAFGPLLAEALLAMGDADAAAGHLLRAYEQSSRAGDEENAAMCLLGLVRADSARGNLGEASDHMLRALDLLRCMPGSQDLAESLGRAITAFQQSVQQFPEPGASPSPMLAAMAGGLIIRHEMTGDSEDLDRAIDFLRESSADGGGDQLSHASRLIMLGAALNNRFEETLSGSSLDEAIRALEVALLMLHASTSLRFECLTNLGNSLRHRYGQSHAHHDLERGVQLLAEAVTYTPEKPEELTLALLNLGHLLRARFTANGAIADLDRAIQLYEKAVQCSGSNASYRAIALSSLGSGLRDRFVRRRERPDIDRAVEACSAAAKLIMPTSVKRAAILSNLGSFLRDRYLLAIAELGPAMRALGDVAVSLNRRAERGQGRYIVNIPGFDGDALSQALDDLDAAIDALEEAAAPASVHSSTQSDCLSNLGISYLDRFDRFRDGADHQRAIECCDAAVTSNPQSAKRALYLNNLANCLATSQMADHPGDGNRASAVYRESCLAGLDSYPEVALVAAGNWHRLAVRTRDWPAAAVASGYGLAAMGQLFRAQLTRADKETWLKDCLGLQVRAAFARIESGDRTGAVEAIEAGRAMLLSEAMELTRANLDQLNRAGRAELAARYEAAAGRWIRFTT